MKTYKQLFLLSLSLILLVGSVFAQKPRNQKPREDFRVLAEGSQSGVEEPFIFVARDEKTYAQMQNLVQNLPSAATINFKKYAAVAAFAGMKPTGGWGVTIKRTPQVNMIDVSAPPKGAMTTQMITTPFKAVLIPVEEDAALSLDSGATWANAMQNYRVTSGDFESAGGFAGRRLNFRANGGVSIWIHGDYVTVFLSLRGLTTQKNRRLMEYASGTLKNGTIVLERIAAGGFVDNPNPPFGVTGTVDKKNIFLNFKSLPTMVRDGFTGSGKIGATRSR